MKATVVWRVEGGELHVRVQARTREQAQAALINGMAASIEGWVWISGQTSRRVGRGARCAVDLVYEKVWHEAPPMTETRVQEIFGELAVLAARSGAA